MGRFLGSVTLSALVVFCAVLLPASASSAAPAWLAPVDLSAAGENAFGQSVASDEQGESIAVWERSNGTNTIVQSAIRPAGGAWPAGVDLSAPGQSAVEPRVAANLHGEAYAVWVRPNGKNKIIQVAQRPAGGPWQPAVDLSATGQDANEPSVAVDGAGDAIAVWDRFDGSNFIVQAAVHPAGGSWQAPIDLSAAGQTAELPEVALDTHGNAVAVWERSNGTNVVVQAATRPAGGEWQPAVRLSEKGEDAGFPHVAFDAHGNATAAWSRSNGSNMIAEAAVLPAGGSWQEAMDLSLPGKDADEAQLAVDPEGDAVVVWQLTGGAHAVIQAASRLTGGSWQAPVELSDPGQGAGSPQIAIDSQGTALAAWERFNGTNNIVQAALHPKGGPWQAGLDLSAPGESATQPQIALDEHGNAVAVWQRSNGTNEIVQAAGYDGAGPLLNALQIPASGIAGQPLAFSVSPFDAWSAVGSIGWTFGDGAGASGANVTHIYPAAGRYTVTLSSADVLGNSVTAAAAVTVAPAPPVITGLSQSHSTWRAGGKLAAVARRRRIPVGTSFSFRLNEAARLNLTFTQQVPGRRKKGRCVPPTHKNRAKPRCRRTVSRGTLALGGHAAINRILFQGRLSRTRRLKPGRYKLVLVAVNTAGQRSRSLSLSFKIVR